MWNSTGTVSVTNGSPVVTGAGTVFSFPNAQPGQAFVGPNGLPMEIASVDSASQITLARPYGGATAAGQPFTILPTQSFANDLALAFAGFKNIAGAMLDTIGQGMFPDGTVASPGIRFAADQDTGMRRPGNNMLAWVTGGVDRMVATPNGVGIGTMTPGRSFDFRGGTSDTGSATVYGRFGNLNKQRFVEIGHKVSSGTRPYFQSYYGDSDAESGATPYDLLLNPDGGVVGIGTAAPRNRLSVRQVLDDHNGNDVAYAIGVLDSTNGIRGTIGIDPVGFHIQSFSSKPIILNKLANDVIVCSGGGNLLAGIDSGSCHRVYKVTGNQGAPILAVGYDAGTSATATFYGAFTGGAGSAATAMALGQNSITGRSLNAGGTINASGADYAEYVRKSRACGTILKGDVCGIDSNGELTRKWADARRYVIKSTDPNLVGGDTWAAHLGPRPEAPLYAAPAYDGPAEPTEADGRSSLDAYTAAQDDYAKAVAAAEATHAAAVKDYAAALTAWEVELEAARQTVDRIAFSGQVPVNVDADTLAACQAALGDGVAVYLVAVANGDGIGAAAVRETDMTLPLYMRRLGAVWAIRDGRPWVDVQHG